MHTSSGNIKVDTEALRANGGPNGHAIAHRNGYARADRRIQDAEEFELSDLDSEDGDDEASGDKERIPLVTQH